MKKILFILLMATTICGCDKDTFNGHDKLPPETQTGANTAGCLINGQVFLPHQSGLSAALVCNYEYIEGEFFFNLYFADQRGGDVKTVGVQTHTINLQVGQTYILNKNSIDNADFIGGGGQYYLSSILTNNFYTNTIKTGELKITRIDLSNSIISGTFWFDAINASGEIVQIRQGRFDMQY